MRPPISALRRRSTDAQESQKSFRHPTSLSNVAQDRIAAEQPPGCRPLFRPILHSGPRPTPLPLTRLTISNRAVVTASEPTLDRGTLIVRTPADWSSDSFSCSCRPLTRRERSSVRSSSTIASAAVSTALSPTVRSLRSRTSFFFAWIKRSAA